jgi:hypothetical protein
VRGDHGETYLTWNASGVPIKQIVQLDKSYGADGIAVRGGINKVADLKGKPSVSMHQEPPLFSAGLDPR